MGGGGGFNLSFPPFHGAVKMLVLINVVVYFLGLLLGAFSSDIARYLSYFALVPYAVLHGHIYQIVTYAFLHSGFWHIFFNMLTLWMFGATLEGSWGKSQFYEIYFFCVIGAALLTIAISYTGLLGISPLIPTVGASGGVYGLLVAFGILFADQEV